MDSVLFLIYTSSPNPGENGFPPAKGPIQKEPLGWSKLQKAETVFYLSPCPQWPSLSPGTD